MNLLRWCNRMRLQYSPRSCSFCGRSNLVVTVMIASQRWPHICDRCVDKCMVIVAQ